MNELERQVLAEPGEVVESEEFPYELDSYEDHENALITERQSEDVHRWHQCRIAASAVGRFERGLVKQLARAAGLSEQTIYDFAKAWRLRQMMIEEASEVSGQPETLTPTHYVEASYDDNPREVLESAEDEEWSTYRTRNEVRERKQKSTEKTHGQAEKVEASECPSCGAASRYWQRVPAELARGG